MNDSRSLARQTGFGFAGGLILLGVFGLLWNFNVLPDGFWGEFWTLWPLLLVAVGVNLVLSRQRAWLGSLAALAVVTGSLGAAWVLAVADPSPPPSLTFGNKSIWVPSDGAQSARLNLTVAGGDLSLTSGAPPGVLLAGGSEAPLAEVTDQRVSVSTLDGQRMVGPAPQRRLELPVPAAPRQLVRSLDVASRRRHPVRYTYRRRSIDLRFGPAGAECAEPERRSGRRGH